MYLTRGTDEPIHETQAMTQRAGWGLPRRRWERDGESVGSADKPGRSYCTAQGSIFDVLRQSTVEKKTKNNVCIHMYDSHSAVQ